MNHPPKIRPGLDFFPVRHEGQQMICVRDPLKIAEEVILVPPHAFFILCQMDGRTDLVTIQAAFNRQFGQLIFSDQINELVKVLDERGFMDSPDFQARLAELEAAYRDHPVRPAVLAGQAYPEERDEIAALLDRFLEGFDREDAPPSRKQPAGRLRGLVAPHIDLNRGGHLFAGAYSALRNEEPPQTALILGTAHFGDGSPFILTVKDFETPLGTAPVDRIFCERLIETAGSELIRGEFSHRSEHSVEFQVLWLQHLFGRKRMPRIVPVLCSSVQEQLDRDASPAGLPEVSRFLEGVRSAVEASEGPVLVIAGADLSHVGSKFGTPERISEPYLERVRQEDGAALGAAMRSDGEGFYREVARISNRNNICSVTSIYALLKLLEGSVGILLGYDLAVDRETDSAVGFAAMNFFG